eukprot:Colp12_sorted_trinity150504_noHs@28300
MDILNLEDLLKGKDETVRALEECLSLRGWCFIKLNEDLANKAALIANEGSRFFQGSEKEKAEHHYAPHFGYADHTASRQTFRILTGSMTKNVELPSGLGPYIQTLASSVDETAKKLLEVCGQRVFGYSPAVIAERKFVPLIMTPEDVNSKNQRYSGYGILEINQQCQQQRDNSNEPREQADAGLFAITLVSTSKGLQLLDIETNRWVTVPPKVAVLSCGTTAQELTKGRLKVAWHRVDMGVGQTRTTVWYEVCALDQIPKYTQQHGLHKSVNAQTRASQN